MLMEPIASQMHGLGSKSGMSIGWIYPQAWGKRRPFQRDRHNKNGRLGPRGFIFVLELILPVELDSIASSLCFCAIVDYSLSPTDGERFEQLW